MNAALAWFITFNFVNIAWVFFRAKEWDDAIKVLKAMFGMSGISLHPKLENILSFLTIYGFDFKGWPNIAIEINMILYLIGASILLMMNNSNYLLKNHKFTLYNRVFFILIFTYAILNLSNISEFIYFNF
ncbi:hypothetical protein [Sulfurimonas sp.]|uniref:hypothetical protein n=1 Tax=Sulfurimonas sp. TaxID=2022749 RepID=UPI003564B3A8